MSLPPALAAHQKKTVTVVGPDTHVPLPFPLTVSAFGHVQRGMLWHSSGLEFQFPHSKNQLRSGLSPSQGKSFILTTVQRQELPTSTAVSKSSFSGCPLVPNVSLWKSEYRHSSNTTWLYNTQFWACISIQM